jgi:hypothetical protein
VIRGVRSLGVRVFLITVASAAFFVSFQLFSEKFGVETTTDVVNTTNQVSQAWATHGTSGQIIESEFTSPAKMLAFAPLGAFTALFRPLPGEVLNVFGLLAGLENAVLIGLVVLAVRRSRWIDLRDPILGWLILFVFVWSFVYGFVSYQNLGTAVRFKLQVLPVMLGLLLWLGRKDRGVIPAPASTDRRKEANSSVNGSIELGYRP